jgi:hypothetical protein
MSDKPLDLETAISLLRETHEVLKTRHTINIDDGEYCDSKNDDEVIDLDDRIKSFLGLPSFSSY